MYLEKGNDRVKPEGTFTDPHKIVVEPLEEVDIPAPVPIKPPEEIPTLTNSVPMHISLPPINPPTPTPPSKPDTSPKVTLRRSSVPFGEITPR